MTAADWQHALAKKQEKSRRKHVSMKKAARRRTWIKTTVKGIS